jgi:ParB family chromosome partitioning protein
VSEASRQLAEEMGKDPETVRKYIREEQVGKKSHLSELAGTDKFKPLTLNDTEKKIILKEARRIEKEEPPLAHPHVSNNSGENEWYTPPEYIEAARKVMGIINFDPASSELANNTVKAIQYYTAQDDGLIRKWAGNVWLNPPYAQPLITQFAEAVTNKYENKEIEQACILVNNATETKWFQVMLKAAAAVCFITGRIKFIDMNGRASGAPLQGQSVLYMGDNIESFINEFSVFGVVMVHG